MNTRSRTIRHLSRAATFALVRGAAAALGAAAVTGLIWWFQAH